MYGETSPRFYGSKLLTGLKVKPLSPLRSSDRRKIADHIIADFHVDISTADKPEGEAEREGASGLAASRNALLPENALYAKFTTTAGPELKQVSGTVYVGAHPGEAQRVLWVKLEERMFPTGISSNACWAHNG